MARRLLLALFLALPFVTLWSPGAGADGAQDGSPRDRFTDGEMAQCRLCHRARFDAFTAGAHGTGEVGCLDCHDGADEHAASLGHLVAPHPRTYAQPRALSLCTGCHDPGQKAFGEDHRDQATADRSCLACHTFHEVTAALDEAPAPRRSHGRAVPAAPTHAVAGMAVTEGVVEVGIRGITGGDRLFRTHSNLEPGPRLVHAAFAAEDAAPDAGLDHFAFDVTGIGDPVSRGHIEVGDHGAWNLRLDGFRHELLFDLDTELPDAFTIRAGLGGELEWHGADGGDFTLGLERHERREDALLTRFRDVSNARFTSVNGDQVETTDLLRFGADWTADTWRLQSKSTLRRWRITDARDFLAPNGLLDDVEDFTSKSRAVTASTSIFAEGPVMDDRGLLDFEVFLAASRRRFDADAFSAGVDENGDAYEGLLDADGEATGRYGRVEAGLAWELTDTVGASLRLRFRQDREESDLDLYEEIEIPPDDPPVVTETDVRTRLTQRTFDVEAMVLTLPMAGLELDLGYGGRFAELDTNDPYDEGADPSVHGVLLEARAHPSDTVTVHARARAFATDDPYTRLGAERHDLLGIDTDWRASDRLSLTAGLTRSRTALEAGGSRSDLDAAHLAVVVDDPDGEYAGRFGVTGQDYDLRVQTTAQVTGFPTPYTARFAGRSYLWNAHLWWRPADDTRLWSTFDLANVLDDASSNLYTAALGVDHTLSAHLALRSRVAAWRFDGPTDEEGDFRTTVFEVSIEYRR